MFLVKTATVPFLQYADTDHKQAVIQRVINTMTDEVLTYKGLHQARDILNRHRRST